MRTCLVSILMPIYKTNPQFLKEAIDSMLNQTFSDFEFLILDDCPEDDREEVVLSFKDKRIKYFKNEKNMGITLSRNKLIEKAHGRYLAIMDHDDVALPTRLSDQVKILNEKQEVGVVGCWVEKFPKNKLIKYLEENEKIEEYLMQGCAIPHTGAMIRKSCLGNIRYDKRFSPAEDYYLWCQLIGKTKFYNIPKILMKYRWHQNNTSKKQAQKMAEKTKMIRQIVRQKNPDIWKKFCQTSQHFVRLRLFGLIPCGKFMQHGTVKKGFLKYCFFIKCTFKMVNK